MGYSPYLLSWFIGSLGDYYRWGQVYMNELAALTVVFSAFHCAAVIYVVRYFRKAPLFTFSVCVAASAGIFWAYVALPAVHRESSKLDTADPEMLSFMRYGGGWLIGFLASGLLVAWGLARFLENRRRGSETL